MRVFLGITGASGAPYAARLLDALHGAGAEVGVAASSAGIEVLATELYGDAEPSARRGDGALHRQRRATVYDAERLPSPYASGSAKIDAYVICPCSMSTVGTIATGAMANLIHRAASVALKEERRLVLVPRETPLSTIHLGDCDAAPARARRSCSRRRASTTAPSPSTTSSTSSSAAASTSSALENTLMKRWGQS